MKKALMWVLMVLLFTGLLVGGTLGLFYWRTQADGLPETEASFGEVSLGEPVGWQWDVPVFWGASSRRFEESPSLSVHRLGTLHEAKPQLAVPEWVTDSLLVLEDGAGGEVFSGSLAAYEDFGFAANGDYTATLRLAHDRPEERPARPQGWYQYSFRFTLSAAPGVAVSKESVAQGGVVGIKLTGVLGTEPPRADCDLGPVWFCRERGDWVGYLPVSHNAEAGTHTLTVVSDGNELTRDIEVYQKDFDRIDPAPEPAQWPAGAGEEYRQEIWPLYEEGSLPRRWLGAFTQPVKAPVLVDYGAYLIRDGSVGRASDLTLDTEPGQEVVMPSDGVILFAGDLKLGGLTVVIDHGCGLKTYLSGLGAVYVQEGDTRLQTEAVGETGGEPLVVEMRIGNKSISPWEAWRGNGGLFYP